MGAEPFYHNSRGDSAACAFSQAVAYAEEVYGNGGYTGTIAEKGEFTEVTLPEGMDPYVFAETLVDQDDERIANKWGPAGAIDLGDGEWLFFGWASS